MIFVNTVELDFGVQPLLTMLAVHKWIRSLGVSGKQLYGIMPIPLTASKVIRMKFKTALVYREFLAKYEGSQQMTVGDLTIDVTVKEAGTYERFVRIQGAPFEITDDDIKTKFGHYGKISFVRREKYVSMDPEEAYFPVLSGAITVRMHVKTHIPSQMNLAGSKVQVSYHGQPATCFKCNKSGHIGAHCPEKKNQETRFPGKWATPKPPAPILPVTTESNPEDQNSSKSAEVPPQTEAMDQENQKDTASSEEQIAAAHAQQETPLPALPSSPIQQNQPTETSPVQPESEASQVPPSVPFPFGSSSSFDFSLSLPKKGTDTTTAKSIPQTDQTPTGENSSTEDNDTQSEPKTGLWMTTRNGKKKKKIAQEAATPYPTSKVSQVAQKLNVRQQEDPSNQN
jgi:hypothetical protein